MKQYFYNLCFATCLFLFMGCIGEKPTFEDLIGTWISSDGSKIILKADSTCILENLNGEYFGRQENLNNEGSWYIEKNDIIAPDNYNIHISLKKEREYITLYISGEGPFGIKKPWHLFEYIGDPDSMNKYKFTKQGS